MRGTPARHRAWRGEGGWPNATKRHLAQALAFEKLGIGVGSGAAAAIEVTHLARFGVVDQPKSVATHAGHVRVNHAQHRSCGDGGVNG